jgi:tetratricopeptide (TPR) repeat protein
MAMKTIGLTLALTAVMASTAFARPKTTKVGNTTLYVKGCEVIGVDSQSCTLCTDEALTQCEEYLCDRDTPPTCAAIRIVGPVYGTWHEALSAVAFYSEALTVATETGDLPGEGFALGELGLAYAATGQVRRAVSLYERALAIERELGSRGEEGAVLGNLGQAHAELGDPRRAFAFYEQALDIATEIGCRRGVGNTLYNMSLALDGLGDRTQAVTRANAALNILERLGDPHAFTVRRQLALWR